MDGPEDSLTEYDAEEDTGKGNYEKKILPHEFSGVGGHLTGTLRGRHVLAIHLGEQVLGEPSRGLLLHFTRPPVSGVDGGGGGGTGRARGGRSSGRSPRRFCQVPFSRSLAVNGGAPATPQRPRVAVLGVFRKIRAERAITTRSHRTFQQAAALPRALRRGDPTDIRIRFDVVPSQRCHRSMIALLPSRYPPRVTLSVSLHFRTLPAISSTGFARSSSLVTYFSSSIVNPSPERLEERSDRCCRFGGHRSLRVDSARTFALLHRVSYLSERQHLAP